MIVFTGLAGGASARLLAAAQLLMQLAFLPVYLWIFVGGQRIDMTDVGPFVEAFVI